MSDFKSRQKGHHKKKDLSLGTSDLKSQGINIKLASATRISEVPSHEGNK